MAKATQGPVTDLQHKRSFRGEGGAIPRGYGVMAGTADDQVKLPTGAAVRTVGAAQEATAAAGDILPVVIAGECIGIAGAAITRGDRLKVMASGKWEPGNAADVETGGVAMTTAAADGDEFVLFVQAIQKRS
jgi:hypothetical protein